jgi:hypothetical protein
MDKKKELNVLQLGKIKFNKGNLVECFRQNLSTASSQRIKRPSMSITGMVGKPISIISGSAFSITFKPSL